MKSRLKVTKNFKVDIQKLLPLELQKDVKKSGRNQAIKTERSNSNEKKQKDKTKNNGNTNRSQDNLNETASSQRALGYY